MLISETGKLKTTNLSLQWKLDSSINYLTGSIAFAFMLLWLISDSADNCLTLLIGQFILSYEDNFWQFKKKTYFRQNLS